MNLCRLFSDFNCPFCYGMHEHLHGLGLMRQVSWHGVQHARHLRVPMAVWSGHLAVELKQEVEVVRRLAPEVPITTPRGKPNSGPALAAAARALTLDPTRAQAYIRSLYRLLWVEGQDISDEHVLQREADRHGFVSAQIVGATAIEIASVLSAWETLWVETEHQGVPLLERSDHALLAGLMPADTIRQFLAEA